MWYYFVLLITLLINGHGETSWIAQIYQRQEIWYKIYHPKLLLLMNFNTGGIKVNVH